MDINLTQALNKFTIYIKTMPRYEALAWGSILLGFVLLILSLIFWK